jgi:hypothetical protein
MPFDIAALNRELLLDNPTYERVLRSDLHAIVEILRQVPAQWSPEMIAAEMKRVSAAKWLKYARTRRYLEREIPRLTALLRATPTGFRTILMSSQMNDTILRHTFAWTSDTGNLLDLAGVVTREKVTWPQWPAALTACIGPSHAAYRAAGHHTGLAANQASLGQGNDEHALMGPFNQSILNYRGAAVRAPMEQVYEYSYDRANWVPIPNSTFSIVREVTEMADGRVQLSITKSNQTKLGDRFVVRRIFSRDAGGLEP